MTGKPAVFVGDQRQRQGVARAEPFDDPTLYPITLGMIGGCGGDDLIEFVFIAGLLVADRHGNRAPLGAT
jgi:hypothetical protein